MSATIVFMKGTKLMPKFIFPVSIYIVTMLIILGIIENSDVLIFPSLTVLASTERTLIVADEKRAKVNVMAKNQIN